MSKGVKGASDEFEYGLSWLTSRRARLKVYENRLECGDWTIPNPEILDALLFETRSGIFRCYVLKLRTSESTYQFGLNYNAYWKGELPFETRREKGRLKFSAFSIALRIFLVAMLLWYLYKAVFL